MTQIAAQVSCCFLAQYFKEFSSDNMLSLLHMYSDHSYLSFAFHHDPVAKTRHGKSEITEHLKSLQTLLGSRKVQVHNADYVATPSGVIGITCSGQVHTELTVRVFTHTFLLAQTENKDQTYYIAGESLRFLNEQIEVVPPGATLVTLAAQQQMNQNTAKPKKEEVKEAPPPPVKNQPPPPGESIQDRILAKMSSSHNNTSTTKLLEAPMKAEEVTSTPSTLLLPQPRRQARSAHNNTTGSNGGDTTKKVVEQNTTAPALPNPPRRPASETVEKKEEERPAAVVATSTAATNNTTSAAPLQEDIQKSTSTQQQHVRRPLTKSVTLFSVPTSVRLSEVRDSCAAAFGPVVDARWGSNDSDAIVTFATPKMARDAYYGSGQFKIKKFSLIIDYFFES